MPGAGFLPDSMYAAMIKSDGASAYWKCGDAVGSATVKASAGINVDGVNSNMVNGQSAVLVSQADTSTTALFNGTTALFTIAAAGATLVGTGTFSFEYWQLMTSFASGVQSNTYCVASGSPGPASAGWGFGEGHSTGAIGVRFSDGTHSVIANMNFDIGIRPTDLVGTIAHYVWVFDRVAGRISCYVNGKLNSSTIDISTVTGSADPGASMTIGGAFGWRFTGTGGHVAMYNKVGLTAAQTLQHYQSGAGISQPGDIPTFFSTSLPSKIALPKQSGSQLFAHIYSNTLAFRTVLRVLNVPTFKWTINAGHHETILQVSSQIPSAITQGDVVRITETGPGAASKVIYSGILEDIVEDFDNTPYHELHLSPLVIQLSEVPFSHNYTVATDIAQMVRDVVSTTQHLSYTPESIPNAGITGIYNFVSTNGLEVLNVARKMAGYTFWWYVDEQGVVWFQSVNTTGKPWYTFKRGQDYSTRKTSNPIRDLKNYVAVEGGVPTGKSSPIIAIVSDATSITKYGARALATPFKFSTLTDQATLNLLANTILNALNRVQTSIELTVDNFGERITLGRVGGPTARYWEPITNPQPESAIGAGYSPTYVILDVEQTGPRQKITMGVVPITENDLKYELDRIYSRQVVADQSFTNTVQGGIVNPASGPPGVNTPYIILDSNNQLLSVSDGNIVRVKVGFY